MFKWADKLIRHPFQAYSREIKVFLLSFVILQAVMLPLVLLGAFGFDIPVVRQVIGFIYLTFIPGYMLLCLIKPDKLDKTTIVVYSVGLSLAFNMFLGFLINIVYPLVGIAKPISSISLIITWIIVNSIFCYIFLKREKDTAIPLPFEIKELLSPQVLFLILLPLLSLLAVRLLQVYLNNTALIILICLIGIVPLLSISSRLLPEKYYPFALYCMALALLWHQSLSSEFLIRYDSFAEYHYFNLVNQSGVWDFRIPQNYNGMLSITVLPAVFCQVMNISGEVMFKVIYQILYALVPVALYLVYKNQFGSRRAFLAAFFFTSIYVYFLLMPSVGREMIAELFCALLILQVTDTEVTAKGKTLFIIWGASMAVSLYSLSYIYIGFLIIAAVILYLFKVRKSYISLFSAVLFIVICLTWYMYLSSASSFSRIIDIGKDIYSSIITDFFNVFNRDINAVLATTLPDTVHLISRIIWYLILLFLLVGAASLFSLLKKKVISREYGALALINYVLLGLCVVLPFFSNTLGWPRMVHIAYIILAPFCIIGGEIVFKALFRIFKFVIRRASPEIFIETGLVVVLVLYFIFNSSLPNEIAATSSGRSHPLIYSHIKSGERMPEVNEEIQFWSESPVKQEVSSAQWLSTYRNKDIDIYASYWSNGVPVLISYAMIPTDQTIDLTPETDANTISDNYIYLGYVNTVLGYGTTTTLYHVPTHSIKDDFYWDISRINPILDRADKIYANGSSTIYWAR